MDFAPGDGEGGGGDEVEAELAVIFTAGGDDLDWATGLDGINARASVFEKPRVLDSAAAAFPEVEAVVKVLTAGDLVERDAGFLALDDDAIPA